MKKKNEAFVPKKNEPRGAYILHALEDHFLNGDAYTTDDEAIHICMQAAHGIFYRQLRSDMDYLISIGKLVFEGSRLYLAKTKRYEDFAAKELAEILNKASHAYYAEDTDVKKIYLTFDCGYENGYTDAILDALKAVALPAVEVHISQVSEREPFRQVSYAGMACVRTYMGLGFEGYRQAILFLAEYLKEKGKGGL